MTYIVFVFVHVTSLSFDFDFGKECFFNARLAPACNLSAVRNIYIRMSIVINIVSWNLVTPISFVRYFTFSALKCLHTELIPFKILRWLCYRRIMRLSELRSDITICRIYTFGRYKSEQNLNVRQSRIFFMGFLHFQARKIWFLIAWDEKN